LRDHHVTPHFVLEQAVENKSSRQWNALQAHRKSWQNLESSLRTIFD
jgi:hypothetical protein